MGRLAGIGGDFRQSAKGAFQYKIGTDSLCCLKERKSVSFHSGGYHRPEYLTSRPHNDLPASFGLVNSWADRYVRQNNSFTITTLHQKTTMQILLIIIALAVAPLAYFLYPRYPIMMRVVTACFLLLCLGGILFLMYGPRDYMEQVSASLTNAAHPWIIGLAAMVSGILFLLCAVGSFIGCLVDHANRKCKGEKAAASNPWSLRVSPLW